MLQYYIVRREAIEVLQCYVVTEEATDVLQCYVTPYNIVTATTYHDAPPHARTLH